MSAAPEGSSGPPRKPPGVRIALLAGVVVVVFLAGIGVGLLIGVSSIPTIQVTPSVVFIGDQAGNSSTSTSCNGGSQTSFNGYFECAVSVACSQSGPGNMIIENASAPGASDFVVTPTLPQNLPCDSQDNLRAAGQLGYRGSVTIYINLP
jgi:hypothetical protein